MAARFLQAQQNHHLSGTNLPELALQQQLFGHQLLQQKILEEQLARNRDFFLVSEQAEREKHASQLGLIFHQVRFFIFFFAHNGSYLRRCVFAFINISVISRQKVY